MKLIRKEGQVNEFSQIFKVKKQKKDKGMLIDEKKA